MEKITVKFQNCYGIKELNQEFDFSKSKTFAIYAPNGVMKTSFAKTFMDVSKDKSSQDLMFPRRTTIREIQDENNTEIQKEQVFVIEPYNEQFRSDQESTLLANTELKNQYDEIHKKINDSQESLLNKLKQLSGIRSNIEEEIYKSFGNKNLFEIIEALEKKILADESPKFANIIYNEIFNDKVIGFLKTKDFTTQIQDYINKYHDLLGKSKYLKQGFDHYKASTIQKNLKDNGFFQAQHSINLYDGKSKQEIIAESDFEKVIQEEKNAILNNSELSKKWDELDKKLSANIELRSFRNYLFNNRAILPELENLNQFAKEIWISYLIEQKDLYKNFLTEYKNGKIVIEKLVEDAKKQRTGWENVINIFNKRFFVPFELKIENQDDVILKGNIPSIKFIFKDSGDNIQVERNQLLKVLSNGEKRALYILNIIFEVEARKKAKQETLFIVDDIADSFDYKNKYAIIEYLKEMSDETNFYLIVLTHNFDFFRTIQGRILDKARWTHSLIAQKGKNQINLIKGGDRATTNPFEMWKKHLNTNEIILIATIPFIRNLIEYKDGDNSDNYKKLTSLLHIKDDTKLITINDLESIYLEILKNTALGNFDKSKKVIDLIYEVADKIYTNPIDEGLNLENKIALSIGIRLKAEELMWKKVRNQDKINGNQTGKLFERFKTEFKNVSSEEANIKILEQMNLMTPENIHLNSFMYEPILDLSHEHLKQLYNDIKLLT